MATFNFNYTEVERVQEAMQRYSGNVEGAVNDVFHNYVGDRVQEDIFRLMPVSRKSKGRHAKFSESLWNKNINLGVIVKSEIGFEYLYFPDDGSNTYRHVGNQHFFYHGAEAAVDDVLNKLVQRLTNDFDKGV